MDWTSIIVAAVTAAGSFLGVYYANRKSAEKAQALISYRLEQLEIAVNKHNQVVSRVYKLEEAQAVTDEKIKVVDHRLEGLERKGA